MALSTGGFGSAALITPVNPEEESPELEWSHHCSGPRLKRKRGRSFLPNTPARPKNKRAKVAEPRKQVTHNSRHRALLGHVNHHQKLKPLINPYTSYFDEEKNRTEQQTLLKQQYSTLFVNSSVASKGNNLCFVRKLNESGSYGHVRLHRHRFTGLEYVIKTIIRPVESAKDLEEILSEACILSVLDKCKYINRFYDCWFDSHRRLNIQLEYCPGGDLYQLLCSVNFKNKNSTTKINPFTNAVIIRIIKHITIALNFIHTWNIVHLDLKPQNILIRGDKHDLLTADFIVGDFGNARHIDSTALLETGDGRYLAPELLHTHLAHKVNLYLVDVFGIGQICHELMRRKNKINWKKEKQNLNYTNSNYTSELVTLVKHMISPLNTQRPTIDQILHLPFIQSCNTENQHEAKDAKIQELQSQIKELRKSLKKKS